MRLPEPLAGDIDWSWEYFVPKSALPGWVTACPIMDFMVRGDGRRVGSG